MPEKSEPAFRLFTVDERSDRPAAGGDTTARAGVRAAKQARSLRKQQALLQAGRRLLGQQDYASLSVAALTRAARMSVGSFYARFDDKEAWFAELLRSTGDEVLDDTRALLDSPRWARAGDRRKVALIVAHLVAVHRAQRGIFRAVLGDAARAARFGAPLHAYGQRVAEAVHGALAPHMRRVPRAQRRLRVGIALQLVYGVLVNAVLRDPGPLALDDPRLERELAAACLAALRL
jgi:AcrR family transcriptional regulator